MIRHFGLSILIALFISTGLAACAEPEHELCDPQPPDWFIPSYSIPIEDVYGAYFENESGRCRLHRGVMNCGAVCTGWTTEEQCERCRDEVHTWRPFLSMRHCQYTCIHGAYD